MTPVNSWLRAGFTILIVEERLLSASELARSVGCSRKALRVYQAHGLLAPSRGSGHQRYGPEAYHRLRLIVALRAIGMSIAEIATLFEVGPEEEIAGPLAARLQGEISDLVRDVTWRLEELVQIRQRLISARETLLVCSSCSRPRSACHDCATAGTLDSVSRALLAGMKSDPARAK